LHDRSPKATKSARPQSPAGQPAGRGAAALAPPGYGVDFVDRGLRAEKRPQPESWRIVQQRRARAKPALQAKDAPVQRTVNLAATVEQWMKTDDPRLAKYYEEGLSPEAKRVFEYVLRLPGDHKVATPADIDRLIESAKVEYFGQVEYFASLYRRSRYFQATPSANLPSIFRIGLDPAHGGVGGASETRKDPEERESAIEESRGYVHLATNLALAREYAQILENPEGAEKKPASILRVFLDAKQRASLSVDLASDDARKTPRLIPPQHLRPYQPSEARIPPPEHLPASHVAMLRSILSFDDKKLIAPREAHEVAARAFRERRISFAGYEAGEQKAGAAPEEKKDGNPYRDIEGNPQPIDPLHMQRLRAMRDNALEYALEETLRPLARSPWLLGWVYSRLGEVLQEKLSRVLYWGQNLSMDEEDKALFREVIPRPFVGGADPDWDRAVFVRGAQDPASRRDAKDGKDGKHGEDEERKRSGSESD
jgi:hypothetical protein